MKISVITATWNSGKTIKDTLISVLNQSFTNIEHIIKDGGSKDDTLEICKNFEQKYYTDGDKGRTINILSDKDKGIYDAMNQGIKAATGDVIGILNSDDFYTSDDVLARVAEEFANNPKLEAVYGDIHFVKDENLKKCTRYFSSRYFRPWALRFGFMPAHPSFYVRREVYEKYGLYDLNFRTSSDFEMMVRLFVKENIRAKYINMDFVTMRAGGESTAGLEAKRKVNRDIAGSLKKHGVYSNQFFQSLRYLWRIGEILYTKIKY
ncbi:glycosyltransferase family 2 protein [uncultured Prevotella sp.]|uniref:glycosyltransferase family 2 protein n=1 Tax=uncultured Prevotella sp. TaxID=159272 RepID=UPI00266B9C24|nr:glycosyltransferase family 2 protein [uncultured Prevotella sp.]